MKLIRTSHWLLYGIAGAALIGRADAEQLAKQDFQPPADADPAELLEFIGKLANPGHDFECREEANAYNMLAATGIADAARLVLERASDEAPATEKQTIRALELRFGALKFLDARGDSSAGQAAESMLREMRNHAQPAVALAVLQLRVRDRIDHWRTTPQVEKQALFDEVARVLEAAEPTPDHAGLLTRLADVVGESSDRARVVQLMDRLLPRLQTSSDPQMVDKLAALQGVVRRLKLPGNPIEVEGELLSGETIDWQEYRGKVVLIEYWATWCGLCHAELPNIRQLHDQYADQGFEVLGVSLDNDKQRVEQFLAKQAIPWPTLFGHTEDAQGWEHPMVGKYGIHDLPRAILVDRDGRVVHMNARGKRLARQLERLIGEPVAKASTEAALGQTAQVADSGE